MSSICPVLRYDDPKAAIDFLEAAFGFTLLAAHRGPDGELAHVEMGHGNGVIMFGSADAETLERFGDHRGAGFNYVVVEDPDGHYQRAVEAGAEIVVELSDQDYGSRDYTARDPEGNTWSFGSYDPADA